MMVKAESVTQGGAEVAEVMGISARTVEREWRAAKAWLYREISKENPV